MVGNDGVEGKFEEMSKLSTNLRIRETEDGEDHIDIAKRRLHENFGIGEKLMVKGRPEGIVERGMDPEGFHKDFERMPEFQDGAKKREVGTERGIGTEVELKETKMTFEKQET